ncbi:MAG: DUF3795 domain-containing protein [bacterium]|nr:DUF3795 domain-containing protein [bacterium]
MSNTICGVDCTKCSLKDSCGGCVETKGHPFHGECIVAKCCLDSGYENCSSCLDMQCKLKEQIISEFNALGIKELPEVESLIQVKGSFLNIEYTLPNGQVVKMLEDDKIYLANQICKPDSDRYFGLAADENILFVSEYGEGGLDGEIILYKKRER